MSARGVYKMSTICELSGFSPEVLRAWERRHGLLEPERTEGGHRLYTALDLEVLRRVRALLDAGRAIGEVAAQGRAGLLAGLREAAPASARTAGVGPAATDPLPRALVEAAVAVDERGVEEVLDRAFGTLSPPAALERVIAPALEAVGQLWAEGRCSVAGEHLTSAKVAGRLLGLLQAINPAPASGAAPAICACLPDEQHEIGALMTACALAWAGRRVVYLGPSLPFEDLERAAQVVEPALICLSVAREALLLTHKPRLCEVGRRLAGRAARLVVGGRGVTRDDPELEAAGFALVRPEGLGLEALLSGEAPRGGSPRPGRPGGASRRARGSAGAGQERAEEVL